FVPASVSAPAAVPAPAAAPAPEAARASAEPPRAMPDRTCTECHQEQISALAATVHRGARTAEGFKASDEELQIVCAGCHGPIAPHGATSPGAAPAMAAFVKKPPEARSAPCLVCHGGARTVHWSGSIHPMRGVACTDCHTLHPKGAPRRGL